MGYLRALCVCVYNVLLGVLEYYNGHKKIVKEALCSVT